MDLDDAVRVLERNMGDPREGLPDEIFYFISKVTPLVNVDLLVQDELGRTLLAWRDDPYCGRGWHVPGGILRIKETLHDRLQKVALEEIGAPVSWDPRPVAIHQLIHPDRQVRSHFLSFLYRCSLERPIDLRHQKVREGHPGYLEWHETCPENLIRVQRMYRPYISNVPPKGQTP